MVIAIEAERLHSLSRMTRLDFLLAPHPQLSLPTNVVVEMLEGAWQ